MSRRPPDDLPFRPAVGGRAIVEALSAARDVPVEALEEAAARLEAVAPAILAVLERAAGGAGLDEREGNLLFWGIHVLAEAAEPRLLPPLLRLMRRPDEIVEELLGDAVTTTFPRIVVSTYDGDWAALRNAIFDPVLLDYARHGLWEAAAFLAATGRIARDDLRDALVAFDAERPVGASDRGWYGWEAAAGRLGFADLAGTVAAARADARLLDDVSGPDDFAEMLRRAAAGSGDLSGFDAAGIRPFTNAFDELDEMLGRGSPEDDGPQDVPEPVRNPLREVGRNDPCPCGSGRKYKKCCLGRDAA